MCDGAPAYFSSAVRDVLNNTYHDRWIGRGGAITWTPRSLDLNPLNFYLWGHLKTPLYAASVENEKAFHHHTVDACQTTRNYTGNFEWIQRSMVTRVKACTGSLLG
jgi:hypothetical protein